MKNLHKNFILAVILCQAAGVFGSMYTSKNIQSWYIYLDKPFFAPPNWLFAPVWILLYLLMALSLALILSAQTKKSETVKLKALVIFIVQLVLNAAWSFLFFGLNSPEAGFLGIIALWLMIVWTTVQFYKIKKTAGYLLIPYLLWVSFAALLNGAIMFLN